MIRLKQIFLFLFLFTISVAIAQNPNGYYNSAHNKKKDELKTALHNIIKNHTKLNYGSLWIVFQQTDKRPDGSVWDMYSNITRYYTSTSGLNREHSFPKSWWGGDENMAYTDINHIFPSDATANGAKSNYPLGVVGNNPSFNNGVSKVGANVFAGYSGIVFEPADEYKGDFARAYFYMVTCYQDFFNKWTYLYMLENNTYPVLKSWAINLLLEWHRKDPVSEKEITRNEAVFHIQNNRNPFIDYPVLVEHIWGNKMDINFEVDQFTQPVLVTPTNDTKLEFGTVVAGYSREMELFVKGNNLTGGNIMVTLYGSNANQFAVSATSIPYLTVNQPDGYCLKVTYSPNVVSNSHQASIIIQGGNMMGSVLVNISGKSIDPNSVTPPVALPATNITSTGFRANWESTDNAFYSLEINKIENGESQPVFDDDYIDANYFVVSELEAEKTYNYTVRKWVSDYLSDPSNVVTVNTLSSIHKIKQSGNITFYSHNKSIIFLNNESKTQRIEIYDIMGILRIALELPTGETKINMPLSGVYIIRNDGRSEKIVVE